MNDEASNETIGTEEGSELLDRRLFLRSMGKWSGLAIAAVVSGGRLACISNRGQPRALGSITGGGGGGGWINRRGYGGGGAWVNRC
jgi:hypothetical protein